MNSRKTMLRKICLGLALLVFYTSSTLNAQDIWTEEDVSSYFESGVWDWRTMDRHEFTTYWGEPIQPPWEIDAALGIPVSGQNLPDPKKGWRLYERHLNCEDYGQPNSPCTPGEAGVSRPFPHFSLYNIYAGTLRTFIYPYLPGGLGNDIRFSITSDIVQGPGYTNIYPIGLFLNTGQYAASLAEISEQKSKGYSTILSAYPKWIVVDRVLSYDPINNASDLGVTFRVHGFREDQMTISGTIAETTNTNANEHPQQDLLSCIEFISSAYDTVVSGIKKVESNVKLSEELDNRADKLKSGGYPNIGSSLSTVADLIRVPGTAIAGLVGASGIVSGIMDLLGGKSVHYTPQTFTVKLDGSLSGERGLDLFKIGVHGSDQNIDPAYTPRLSNPGTLGLFSLSRKPIFECGDDYIRFLDKDLSSYILINPYSNMKLVLLEVQPIVSVPITMEPLNNWSVNNQLYDFSSKQIPGLVNDDSGFEKVIMTRKFEDPASIDIRWDPRSGVRNSDPSIGVQDNSTTRRILLKLYFKFQHKNPEHADIIAEFVQTYQTEIFTCSCSLGPSKDSDTWHATSGSGFVLSWEIGHTGQYTHRPCNIPKGHAVLFRHSYYRGINKAHHHPKDHVGRSEIYRDLKGLDNTNLGTESLSSFMVGPFTALTLYSKKNFRGKSKTFTKNVPQLSTFNWNDKARSIRIHDTGAWIIPLIF